MNRRVVITAFFDTIYFLIKILYLNKQNKLVEEFLKQPPEVWFEDVRYLIVDRATIRSWRIFLYIALIIGERGENAKIYAPSRA